VALVLLDALVLALSARHSEDQLRPPPVRVPNHGIGPQVAAVRKGVVTWPGFRTATNAKDAKGRDRESHQGSTNHSQLRRSALKACLRMRISGQQVAGAWVTETTPRLGEVMQTRTCRCLLIRANATGFDRLLVCVPRRMSS
jgi:hypothetical protein